MIKTYRPPVQLHISSVDTDRSFDNVNPWQGKSNNSLFKKVTPRKKKDSFGRDTTNFPTYFLSNTLAPSAVRATLLADMQQVDPKICSFDVVDRPKAEAVIAKLAGIPHPPPPSVVSKDARQASVVGNSARDVCTFLPEEETHREGDALGYSGNTAVASTPSGTTGITSILRKTSAATGSGCEKTVSRKSSTVFSSSLGIRGESATSQEEELVSITGREAERQDMVRRLKAKMADTKKPSALSPFTKPWANSAAVPRMEAYNQLRLIRYNWQSKESRVAEQKKDGGDIRDPLYLNTFCSDERPVRYHKTSFPSIMKTPRQRPRTVSENNFRNRLAVVHKGHRSAHQLRQSKRLTHDISSAMKGQPSYKSNLFPSKSASHVRTSTRAPANDADEEDLDNRALLEIRPFLVESGVVDQREKLKGANGCLNSRVKQSVRFVRYREKLDKQGDDRPVKYEHGRYRPFSKTDVREHNMVDPPPTPEAKLQTSVETYQKYMETISREASALSTKKPSFRSPTTPSIRQTSFTTPSSGVDTDSLVVQSVTESNLPPSSPSFSSSLAGGSVTPVKDVVGMKKALAIKQLSPKKNPRTVAKLPLSDEPTPRVESASSDEGVDMTETEPVVVHVDPNAIVVPQMPPKSECPSEISMSKDL